MAAQDYEVRVSVKLDPGTDQAAALAGFGKLFKLDAGQVATLFAAGKDAIKRDLDHATASKCQKALSQLGIKCEVRAMSPPDAPPADLRDAGQAAAASLTLQSPPPSPPPPKADFEPDTVHALPLRFHGQAGEYFRIWIVNVVLTILTLGIYSAWAKVRTNRYLYGNTELAGQRFSYLANPITILKGRLIAMALLIGYIVLGEVEPVLQGVIGLIIVLAFPWLLVRALRFNLRMSAYRHIRFGFDGTVGGAYAVFLGWPILAMLSFWLALPFAIFKQQQWLANGYRFGTQRFVAELYAGDFYGIYLRALLFAVGGGLLAFLAMSVQPVLMGVIVFVVYLFVFAYVHVNQLNLVRNAMTLGPHGFASNYALGSWLQLQLVNLLGILFSLGLLIPWAKIRSLHYNAAHSVVMVQGDLDSFVNKEHEQISALGEEIGDVFDVVDVGVGI